jgi:sugar diacid utilization regulator
MPTVQDLVVLTEAYSVALLAPSEPRGVSRRDVRRIVIIQNLASMQTVPENSLVIVPSGLFTRQDSSGLDVLIRRVSERGAIAVLVQGLVQAQSRLQRLTDRFNVAVLGCAASVDLGDLVTTLNYSISGGPADTLLRVFLALDRVKAWMEMDDTDPSALVRDVGKILAEALSFDTSIQHGTPVVVNGVVVGYIGTGGDSTPTTEVQLVLPALLNAIGARFARESQQEQTMIEERSRALIALILADSASVDHYASLARRLSIDVDGFHVALAVQSETDDLVLRDLEFRQAQFELERAFASVKIELQATRVESSFGAILSSRAGHRLTPKEIQSGIQQAIASSGSDALFWGVGTEHVGPTGIRTSMYEARSASNSAAAKRITRRAMPFDASGIQRLISEVRASVTAGRVASEILKPLESLSNRDASLETLNAWLDERGSLKAAAHRLHLHPNAVAYRITKISDALKIDLSDPDTRFALQLACRVALGS